MPVIFIRYTDGLYDITKKVHVENDEQERMVTILNKHKIPKDFIEVQGYDTPTFVIDGYTYYVNDWPRFHEICDEFETILLADKDRKLRYRKRKL